jgi:hypothetical protein
MQPAALRESGDPDSRGQDSRAADSGAVDSSAVDSNAADSSAAEYGAVNYGAADSGELDSGGPDSGGLDSGGLDSGGQVSGGPAAWPGGDVTTQEGSPEAPADAADVPSFWDWAPPDEQVELEDPGDGFLRDDAGEGTAAPAEPPRPAWRPMVTKIEPAGGEPQQPGIGQRRGNLAHLSANPRMRAWQRRAIIAVIVGLVFTFVVTWRLGLTLAIVAAIADTIFWSIRGLPGPRGVKMTRAQRQTRRQLAKLGRAGYHAMHGNLIPESQEEIDHLVVGPAGVFAIDSEAWDRRLAVRTRNGKQLWHGPESMKERLEHARWESQQAAELLSGAVGRPVTVRPAMAVYGPKIPWDVATIREVDVFSGPRLRKYLRRRARQNGVRPLSHDEVDRIYQAANQAFPHLNAGARAS